MKKIIRTCSKIFPIYIHSHHHDHLLRGCYPICANSLHTIGPSTSRSISFLFIHYYLLFPNFPSISTIRYSPNIFHPIRANSLHVVAPTTSRSTSVLFIHCCPLFPNFPCASTYRYSPNIFHR